MISTGLSLRARSGRGLLAALLLVTGVCVGIVGTAERADAVVIYDETPIAGWSTNGPVRVVKVVGDRVYAGGSFTQVRPPGGGAAVARTNLFAVNRTTGALITGFVANANNVVRSLESDGTSLFIGGGFGTINGVARPNLAAVDLATGAVRAFNPRPQSQVYGMQLAGDRLYLGGVFTNVGGVGRNRIAMVNKDTGVLDPTFNPNANAAVRTFAISPDNTRLYVGGQFTSIAGVAQAELVALDPATGTRQPIVFQQFLGEVLELDADPNGTRLYAALGGFPGGGNRAVAWSTTTGVRLWRQEAMGDVQSVEYDSGTVYFSFHEGFANDGTVRMLAADSVTGALDPNFRPTVNSFFGVWSIDSANGTLAVGGEFTNFDGRQVQGLALLPSLFANDTTPPTTPTNLTNPARTATTATLAWGASTDNALLTGYEILRDGVQVGASTANSFTDTGLASATAYSYQVRAVDAAGNRSSLTPALVVTTPLPLVSPGATWRYLDNGTNQDTAWRAPAFNHNAWAQGPAQLGYGEGDESTVVSFGPNAAQKYRTTYFRHAFNVANPATVQSLNLRLLRDDGAVVYLNGTEVVRSNMPAGTINFNTYAATDVDGGAESTFFPFAVPPALLVAGTNTLAVEVQQNWGGSSDLSFDLALDAAVSGGGGGDVSAPSTPGALTLGPVTASSVALSWQPSTDDTGVDHYAVRRDGVAVGTTTQTNFVDATADDGRSYTYTVVARDEAGNTSAASNAVVANTPDVTAPSVPGPLSASGITATSATITWPAATDNVGVTGYTVRRDGNVVGNPAGPSFTDTGLTEDTGYSYTVTARDAIGNVSGPSAPLPITTSGPTSTETLIAARSTWRYLDNGSNQGTAWRGVGFNDSAWAQGPAILGYGRGDEATVVSFGPNAAQKYLTTYFRRTFDVTNAGAVQSLLLRVMRDDGAVAYINGVEVARSNMPAGNITSGSFASTNVNPPQERQFFDFTVPTNLLVTGTNTIAVEVHQNYRSSSDMAFDLALIANP